MTWISICKSTWVSQAQGAVDCVRSAVLEREWTLNDNFYSKQTTYEVFATCFRIAVVDFIPRFQFAV